MEDLCDIFTGHISFLSHNQEGKRSSMSDKMKNMATTSVLSQTTIKVPFSDVADNSDVTVPA